MIIIKANVKILINSNVINHLDPVNNSEILIRINRIHEIGNKLINNNNNIPKTLIWYNKIDATLKFFNNNNNNYHH